MSTPEKKRGKLSKEEEDIILQNLPILSDEEIAALINRTPDVVFKFRSQAPALQENREYIAAIELLQKKFFWPETKQQLIDSDEIAYFEKYWASLYSQFSPQGILPTDELMMRDLIMADVSINRCQASKANCMRELRILEGQIDDAYKTIEDPMQRAIQIDPLNNRANVLRQQLKALNDEWKVYQEKKDKKYEQLKGTRQLRLETAEKSGRSFYDLVKMLDAPEVREKEGRLNEIYKTAAELAKLRFEQTLMYEDEKVDRPFLTPEAELKDEQNTSSSVR